VFTHELEALPAHTRWRVIEQLFDRRSLEALVVHPGTRSRPAPTPDSLAGATIARNPQAAVHLVERRMGDQGWLEVISILVRGVPETLLGGPDFERVPHLRGVTLLLVAGVQYLLLRSRKIRIFGGIDLRSDAGWATLKAAVAGMAAQAFAPPPAASVARARRR